jgi:hypothetical protein
MYCFHLRIIRCKYNRLSRKLRIKIFNFLPFFHSRFEWRCHLTCLKLCDNKHGLSIFSKQFLTISHWHTCFQFIALKNRCDWISANPVCGWQPSLSSGFFTQKDNNKFRLRMHCAFQRNTDRKQTLFRNPFRIDAAFTESDRGIRIDFSRITKWDSK